MIRRVAYLGGRALYVLPLRATVTEKAEELKALVRAHNQVVVCPLVFRAPCGASVPPAASFH